MRTVSFSQSNVQRLLNRDFINTYTNTDGDPSSGMSISHRPNDPAGFCIRGNGKQNVQTIFMTPEGEIFHAATGFLDSKDLIAEAEFAKELFKTLEESEDDHSELVASSHRKRLVDAGFSEDVIADQSPMASMRMLAEQLGQQSQIPNFGSSQLLPGNFNGNNFGFSGSGSKNSRSTGNPNQPPNPLASFSRVQFLDDNKFSIANPLLNYKTFQRDPTKLVGAGKSFFASSSSSN